MLLLSEAERPDLGRTARPTFLAPILIPGGRLVRPRPLDNDSVGYTENAYDFVSTVYPPSLNTSTLDAELRGRQVNIQPVHGCPRCPLKLK